jgi:hypothetical protein
VGRAKAVKRSLRINLQQRLASNQLAVALNQHTLGGRRHCGDQLRVGGDLRSDRRHDRQQKQQCTQ